MGKGAFGEPHQPFVVDNKYALEEMGGVSGNGGLYCSCHLVRCLPIVELKLDVASIFPVPSHPSKPFI